MEDQSPNQSGFVGRSPSPSGNMNVEKRTTEKASLVDQRVGDVNPDPASLQGRDNLVEVERVCQEILPPKR